jgi:UDP-sugar transporter A1/2/3
LSCIFLTLFFQVGGLLVAVVIKYADNVAKGAIFSHVFFSQFIVAFAAAISIISSALFSALFFDFVVTPFFVLGAALVLAATYVYSVPEAANAFVPSFMRELPKTPTLPV